MLLAKACRSWIASVVSCVWLLALWSFALPFFFGPEGGDTLHNVVDISLAFGAVFGVIAAVIYIPLFALLTARLRDAFGRALAIGLGIALAPTAYAGVAWAFREREDPETIWAWIMYWTGHVHEFLIFTVPFALAGVVFGAVWSAQRRSITLSTEPRRAV